MERHRRYRLCASEEHVVARRREGFSARGPARCEALDEHEDARSSQRAWREELLDAEGNIEGYRTVLLPNPTLKL